MYDQSFSRSALERALWKRDFHNVSVATQAAFKELQLTTAQAAALSHFNGPTNPLSAFPLRGKQIYRFASLPHELVARKLRSDLRHVTKPTISGRAKIVGSLRLLLKEGVPYRIYRLDIKSFYESFSSFDIEERIRSIQSLAPLNKGLILTLLQRHKEVGGTGLPRGLSLSAVLSELMMTSFDQAVSQANDVFYYARYVDDIFIITSAKENEADFVSFVAMSLPVGLKLNPQKQSVKLASQRVSPIKAPGQELELFNFDYLGYNYSICEPVKVGKTQDLQHSRSVHIDIAGTKVRRFKTRISRSFIDFIKTSDFALLRDRLKFLTQNFSVYDGKLTKRKLAGIFHSYPDLSDDAKGLYELDRFLRNAVLTKSGKVFQKSAPMLTGAMKRTLLGLSFAHGHANKSFVHFLGTRISEIQKCWMN